MVVASILGLKIVRHAAREMRSNALSCLHNTVYCSGVGSCPQMPILKAVHFKSELSKTLQNDDHANESMLEGVDQHHEPVRHLNTSS